MTEFDLSVARQLRHLTKIIVGEDDECWPWTGATDRKGYGQARASARSMTKAHIYMWVVTFGPVPRGKHVHHTCDNPPCCNPSHFKALTNVENNALSSSPSAVNARKVECIHHHPFSVENTRVRKDGGRSCIACEIARERRRGIAA